MTIIDLREYMSTMEGGEPIGTSTDKYRSDDGADLCRDDELDCCVGGYSD